VLTAGADTLDEGSAIRKGVLFRNNFSQIKTIQAQVELIQRVIEPQVRVEKALAATDQIRMAVVYSDEGSSPVNGQLLFQNVLFNGKSAAQNGTNYAQFSMGSAASPDFAATLAQTVIEIAKFQPHIVVIYDGVGTDDAVIQMEQTLPGLSHFVIGADGAEQPLVDAFGNDETKRRRIWVVQSGQPSTYPNAQAFLLQYAAAFPMQPGGPVASIIGAPQYDQFYLAMYAMAATNHAPPYSGRELGNILLTRFGSGADIQMGPLYIDNAVARVQQGESIIYRGAATSSKFNENGDVSTPSLLLCITKDQQAPQRFVETGIYVDADTNELIGTDGCDSNLTPAAGAKRVAL
jgi:hypothetical protein